jgi:hypothetical protein
MLNVYSSDQPTPTRRSWCQPRATHSSQIPRFLIQKQCRVVRETLASNQSRMVSMRHTARLTAPHLSALRTSPGAWCFWLECWIEDCRLQRIPGTSLPMLQNSTIKPTRNRVQALGGNANTRTVPNPQCPGSTTQLGVPHPKVPDRISEQTGLHGRDRTAYPTGGFAPKIMVGVQAPQPELRSWGQRDLDDLFERGYPPPSFFFPSFLSLKTRFGCDGEPFWKLLQRRKGYNHR